MPNHYVMKADTGTLGAGFGNTPEEKSKYDKEYIVNTQKMLARTPGKGH